MITANYNDYADGGSHKDFEISIVGEQTVIDNSKMLSESIKLQEALCSEQNLRFGACEASQFTVQVANTAGNFKGKTLEVAVTMDEATTKYGTFKVQSDKPTADRIWRVLTAYDAMYDIINADVLEWYSSLTFPMTLANFRNSFFTYLGVTQKSTTLINDSFIIQGGFTATGALSGKTIINAICEFNGVFGHINRDGEFEYISLDGADSFNCPPYENNSVTYEDYVTEAITKVTMKGSADDVGTSVGTDGNEYVIINNPLIYGTEGTQALVTALTNLLNKISLVTYRPYSLNKTIGNPCVELGDAIVISTKYQTINSYVIKRVLSGIQALRDNYSATGDKTYPKEVNTIQSQINRIAGKTSELSYTVDGLQSTVTRVEQTANTALTRANGSITTDTLHYLATPLSSGVTTETAGWTTTPQSMTPTNKYLWTYHTYTYADAHTSDTTPVITGVYGEDGQQGQTGPQGLAGPTGADGLSITEVTSIYYASDSSTTPSAPSSEVTTTSTSVYNTWTKGIPALTSTYNKLYTCDQVKYSDNTFTWTTPVLNSAITTAVSEIQQLANQIVLKVKSDGTVAQVALGADASTGSNVLIKGDNIQLDGNVTITSGFVLNAGVIQSANYVANTSGMKITLSDGSTDSKGFKVSPAGIVTMSEAVINGEITFRDRLKVYDTTKNTTSTLLDFSVTQATSGIPSMYELKFLYPGTSTAYLTVTPNSSPYFSGVAASANYATSAENATYINPLATGRASNPNDGNSIVIFKRVTNSEAPNNGVILEFGNSASWRGQLYIGDNATQGIAWNGWSNGTRGNWLTFLHSGNYTSYIKSTLDLNAGQMYRIGSRCALSDLGTTAGAVLGNNGVFARSYSNTNNYVNVYAAGFSQQSSKLVKENVNPITDEEAKKLLDIDVVSFDYIEAVGGQKNNVGMIAEDMLEIYPNLVQVPENYNEAKALESIYEGNNTETLALDYAKFTPYLIKLVQMQQKQIDELKKLI